MSVSILRLKGLPPSKFPVVVGKLHTIFKHGRVCLNRDYSAFSSATTLSTCDSKLPGWRSFYIEQAIRDRGYLCTRQVVRFRISLCTSVRNFSVNKGKDSKVPVGDSDQPQDEPKKLGLVQKFKQMYRDYWYVLVPVHLVTSIGWFGSFYYMAKSGVDVVALLESMGLSQRFIDPLKDSSAGYIALAYAMYKIATPIRYTVTLGGTTISINYLKKRGYIKPMPRKEKLKEMYQEKKEQVKERRDNLAEELRQRRERWKEQGDNFLEEYKKRAKKGADTISNYSKGRDGIKSMPHEEKSKTIFDENKEKITEGHAKFAEELRQRRERLKDQGDNYVEEYSKRAKKSGVNDK